MVEAQSKLEGRVVDPIGNPVVSAAIQIPDLGIAEFVNTNGEFSLDLPSETTVQILVTATSDYDSVFKTYYLLPDEVVKWKVVLSYRSIELEGVTIVEDIENTKVGTVKIEGEVLQFLAGPNPLGSILGSVGASSNNETSSQYSVRGGNFDENLIYVNGFEVYRPLFIRSGQQEGLPFPNLDLIESLTFSTGGFEPKYGDKMSSVLDIQYRRPDSFRGSVSASFLGGAVHLEGGNSQKVEGDSTGKTKSKSFLLGLRYKSNQYLLNALPQQGQYRPTFLDVQGALDFQLDEGGLWELELLANYSNNRYQFRPESQVSTTGTVNTVLRLEAFFDGQEVDKYQNGFVGLRLRQQANERFRLNYQLSAYRSLEDETFDIIGDYWIGLAESNPGSEEFGQIKFFLGVGTFHDYGRNYIDANVGNAEVNGQLFSINNSHTTSFGLKAQVERIEDDLNEWVRLDSSGYSLPNNGNQVLLSEVFKSQSKLESMRYSAYVQDKWIYSDSSKRLTLTGGVRAQYWDLNEEFIVNPRLQFAYEPIGVDSSLPKAFKAAVGLYHQPPFYRELRNPEGMVNRSLLSQKSLHAVLGTILRFKAWKRDFKFSTEVFYKHLWDLVPYDVENVRITYAGKNSAKGYAAGIEFRLFGELVEGAESWVSLTLLKTQEDILGDSLLNEAGEMESIGFVPRPTDQRVNFGMFFQDYLPGNKNYKMHLSLHVGSGLPFGAPGAVEGRNAFTAPPYRRVDIGFSALLYDKGRRLERERRIGGMLKAFDHLWASLEVFNLLGVSNTSSYIWIKDVANRQFPFPNFLTGRRINLRLKARF